MGNYYLYSVPPFRLKRLFYLSKWIIALNSLILIITGFLLADWRLANFPVIYIIFSLVILPNVIQFIDLKDYKGDTAAGIATLPNVLGLKKAKKLIGFFFILAYLCTFFLIRNYYFLLFAFAVGILQFILINRKIYREKPIFIVYLISLIILIGGVLNKN